LLINISSREEKEEVEKKKSKSRIKGLRRKSLRNFGGFVTIF
jgi:hypothetical protein